MTRNARRMAEKILEFEGRFDEQGNLEVYELPEGDGGGTFEVAGINDRYHWIEARRLRDLILSEKHAEARELAIDIIERYTRVADTWAENDGVRFFLRDTMFNRGPGGAARILQDALKRAGANIARDGVVGPKTKAAAAGVDARRLLDVLVEARERYERKVVGRNEKSPFWRGLVNRWRKARAHALTYLLADQE